MERQEPRIRAGGSSRRYQNAYADNELRPEPGVAYSNYGRIRISQWGKGETDNSNGVEFTKAQSISLPVITEINGIYSLSVES